MEAAAEGDDLAAGIDGVGEESRARALDTEVVPGGEAVVRSGDKGADMRASCEVAAAAEDRAATRVGDAKCAGDIDARSCEVESDTAAIAA